MHENAPIFLIVERSWCDKMTKIGILPEGGTLFTDDNLAIINASFCRRDEFGLWFKADGHSEQLADLEICVPMSLVRCIATHPNSQLHLRKLGFQTAIAVAS